MEKVPDPFMNIPCQALPLHVRETTTQRKYCTANETEKITFAYHPNSEIVAQLLLTSTCTWFDPTYETILVDGKAIV